MLGGFIIILKSIKKVFLFFVILFVAFFVFLFCGGYKKLIKPFYPIQYEDVVNKASETYNVNKELIYAIIKCESNFDSDAHSHADAIGLMQITPDTFKWLQLHTHNKIDNTQLLKDPEINIMYGTLLISILMKKYGNEKVALGAYNAGETVVKRWLADKNISKDGKSLNEIPYKETANYVKRVNRVKRIYKKLYFE